MKIVFILSIAILVITNAQAWSEKGNGGNSIICKDPSQNKFYDAYEAEFRYNLRPIYPEKKEACTTDLQCLAVNKMIAKAMLKRLPDFEPKAYKKYLLNRLETFDLEASFLEGIELIPTDDVGIGFIPKDCTLHQTVIQRKPIFSKDSYYLISEDYWKQLDNKQRAVGIIHELLYGYYAFVSINPVSSERIRFMNALIISGEIGTYDQKKYTKLLNQVYPNE